MPYRGQAKFGSSRAGMSRKEFLRRGGALATLAGLGGAGALAACGQNGGSGGAGSGEQVEIEYWHINTENFGGPITTELAERFQEQNPNITVRERFQEGEYTGLVENLQSALAADDPPDVAQIGYNYLLYVANSFPYVSSEQLEEQFGDGSFFGNFADNILELGQFEGEQAGMPYALSNIITYYNADMLAEAGLDPESPPQSWDEWREASEQILEATGNPGIYLQILDDNWSTQSIIESNGGELLSCEEGGFRAAFAEPQAVEAIQFWADLIDDGLALNQLWDSGEQAFLSGNVATFITTIGKRGTLEEQASFDLRATTFPRFGDQDPRLPGGGNNLFVFSQDPERQRAAWEFVKFLDSPEALTEWVTGTGYLPPREGLAEDSEYLGEFVEENPIQAVAVEQLPLVVPWVSFPGANGLQANNVLFDGLQDALGDGTAEEPLVGAAEQVDGLIDGEECS